MEVKGLKESEVVSPDAGPIPLEIDCTAEKKSPSSSTDKKCQSPAPSDEEMDYIIRHMTTIQLKHTTYTPEFLALREKNEKEFMVHTSYAFSDCTPKILWK